MRRRVGISLVSTLVTIAVIVLLMALLTAAFRHIQNRIRVDATRVTLNNLEAMASELKAAAGWSKVEATTAPSWWVQGAYEVLPGDVDDGSADRFSGPVRHTAYVIEELIRVPLNMSAMGKIPSTTLVSPRNELPMPPYPVALDAWGNPILFIPSGGVTNVWIGGVWHGPDNPFAAPGHRAFFLSAGPDGNFSEGDDNIYSFE